MVVVVEAVTDAETIKACAQIERNSLMSANFRLTAQNMANNPPRQPIKRQPAVPIRLLVE
jgi:hypothetical protein